MKDETLSIPTARQASRGVYFHFISVTNFCLVGLCLFIFNYWVEEPTPVVFPLVVPAKEEAVRFLDTANGLNILLQCEKQKTDTFSFPKFLLYLYLLAFPNINSSSKKNQDFLFHNWPDEPKVIVKQNKLETYYKG